LNLSIINIFATVRNRIYLLYDRNKLKRLIRKGLKVGKNTYIGPNVNFDQGYPYLISIGNNCRISSGTTILVHDASIFKEIGITRLQPVNILDGSFIGINAVILPGVTIGPNAIIAAGSIINRNIGENKIAAGNPARPYSEIIDLIKRYENYCRNENVFNISDIEAAAISKEKVLKVIESHDIAFVRGIPSYDPYYVNADIDFIKRKNDENFQKIIKNLFNKKGASDGKKDIDHF